MGSGFLVRVFYSIVHDARSSFAYFNSPGHYAWSSTDSTDGILGFSQRVHAPAHQCGPTCETVINEDEVVIRIFESFRSMIPSRMKFGFLPDTRCPPREADTGVGQDKAEVIGNINEAKSHACAYPVDDFVEQAEAVPLVYLLSEVRKVRQSAPVLACITADQGNPRLFCHVGIDRDPPKPSPFGRDQSDIDELVGTVNVIFDNLALAFQGEVAYHAPVPEYIECSSSPWVDKPCPLDKCIRDCPARPQKLPMVLANGLGSDGPHRS